MNIIFSIYEFHLTKNLRFQKKYTEKRMTKLRTSAHIQNIRKTLQGNFATVAK